MRVRDLQVGEQAFADTVMGVWSDHEGHVWVENGARCERAGSPQLFFVRIERTEGGIVLWLHDETKIWCRAGSPPEDCLPVVELRYED